MWDVVPIYNLGSGLRPIYFIFWSEWLTDNSYFVSLEYINFHNSLYPLAVYPLAVRTKV